MQYVIIIPGDGGGWGCGRTSVKILRWIIPIRV